MDQNYPDIYSFNIIFNNMKKREILSLEKRLDKSINWVEKYKNKIHPTISFIQAVELRGMGIDVTQLKLK
jgi:predicted RNase H-like nuclease (RuvC/YqgF family)